MAAHNRPEPHMTTSKSAQFSNEVIASGTNAPVMSAIFQPSPFLHLPGELRNQIYAYVFAATTFAFVGELTESSTSQDVRYRLTKERSQHDLALLLVCRQVYQETRTLPFTLGTFKFDAITTFVLVESDFTLEQRGAIAHVHVHMRRSDEIGRFILRAGGAPALVDMLPGVKHMILYQCRNPRMRASIFDWYKEVFKEWASQAPGVRVEMRVFDQMV